MASQAATYLAKYVGKAYDEDAGGTHRYEVAQGFQPVPVMCEGFADEHEARRTAQAVMGHEWVPTFVWRSEMQDGYVGPPCRIVFFSRQAYW